MKQQLWGYSDRQAAIGFCAMCAAYADQLSFTVQGFCARFNFPENRHTRKVLNTMASDGLLLKQKSMFADGHYRMIYAMPPKRLPGFPS